MNRYAYKDAKKIIDAIYTPAIKGEFKSRKDFLETLEQTPFIAVQGYNSFGKIFHWNQAAATAYGYSEEEATNQDLIGLILPPDMQSLARSMIATATRTGKMPEPGPCDLVHKDGRFVAVYSAHLVLQWNDTPTPEFYCLDLLLTEDEC